MCEEKNRCENAQPIQTIVCALVLLRSENFRYRRGCHRLMLLFDFPCLSHSQSKNITMVGSNGLTVDSHPLSLPTLWRFGWLVDIHSMNEPPNEIVNFPFLLFFLDV